MSRVYVDASALFALHVKNDANHTLARAALEKLRGREDLSLVDAVSFLVARRQAVEEVSAYDDDFQREGFTAAI